MQRLNVLLNLALDLNKPHCRPHRSLRDCLGAEIVVLLRLHIGPHVFRRRESNLMPPSGEHPAQMMRAAARLHRDNALPKTRRETLKRTAPHPTPQNHSATRIHSRNAAGVLAKINSKDNVVHRPVPLSKTGHDLKRSWQEGRAIP
jgi:hypothetical protein